MTGTSISTDLEARTMRAVAEFGAPAPQVWQVFADARRLERWWAPAGWTALFSRHHLTVGARSDYTLSGPDDMRFSASWWITAVEPITRIEFDDGTAGDDGRPAAGESPTHTVVVLGPEESGTRVTLTTHYGSTEQLAGAVEMGMADWLASMVDAIDEALGDPPG